MVAKFPDPTEAKYCRAWEAVFTVQLKGEDEMENPPNPTIYDKIHEELDEFKHEVIRLEEENGVSRCTCKTRNGICAVDCRIHPHRIVILRDTSKKELPVPSLFLKPISWDEEMLEMILSETENHQEQSASPLSEADLPETTLAEKVHGPEGDVAEESGGPLTETLEIAGDGDAEFPAGPLPVAMTEKIEAALQVLSEEGLSLIILKDGNLTVEDPYSSKDPNLIFNSESRCWSYAGERLTISSTVHFKNDQINGFVSIIEANFEQLRLVMKTMEFYNNISLRKQLDAIKAIEVE
jgi:hypothetical protein